MWAEVHRNDLWDARKRDEAPVAVWKAIGAGSIFWLPDTREAGELKPARTTCATGVRVIRKSRFR